jgi:hypothetical protein
MMDKVQKYNSFNIKEICSVVLEMKHADGQTYYSHNFHKKKILDLF